MEAAKPKREEEIDRLLGRLSELFIDEQRGQGTFARTPHMCDLECASLALGQRLSRASLTRAVAEAVAESPARAACPACGKQRPVLSKSRTVQSMSGPIDVIESVGHCPACRRDFFPSA